MITAMEGNKMAKSGARRRGAGHLGHQLLRGRHHRHGAGDAVRALLANFAVGLGPRNTSA